MAPARRRQSQAAAALETIRQRHSDGTTRMPSQPRSGPRRDAALAQYRRRAAVYDLELRLFEPLRRRAVDWLAPRRGDTVLDVACGTGLSFGPLQAAVGAGGRIVGIEQSPEMLDMARQRVRRHGWRNIRLLHSAAEEAPLQGQADAALLHFTHDVMRNERAVTHLLQHLRPGAPVVATGLQWAPAWAAALNLFVLPAAWRSVSSLEGLGCPWDRMARHLGPPQLRHALGGCVYLARWQLPRAPAGGGA